jgi:UDP-glucose 4-epimerase
MRALVTGGAGFIGSHLVDALVARGDDVVVLDDLSTGRREFVARAATLVEHDVRSPFESDADVVFHLAAQADVGTSMERPGFDAEVNVVGSVNALEAARAAGAHLVFASTGGAIYGSVDEPADEDSPHLPVSAYGLAKRSAEVYLDGWNRIFGTRHVALRFANVYGPRQSAALEGGVIAIFLERLAAGEPTTIFGDGSITRDFVHVDDVVRALLLAAGHDGGIFNVGTGAETTIADLHALCERAVGVDAPPTYGPPRAGDARRSVLDTRRATRELGFAASVPLAEGVSATYEAERAARRKD